MAVTTAEATDRKGALQALNAVNLASHRCKVCSATAAMWASLLRRAYATYWVNASQCRLQNAVLREEARRLLDCVRTQGHAPALGRRAQLCLARQEPVLWKNCERWLDTSLLFIHLVFSALLLKRL